VDRSRYAIGPAVPARINTLHVEVGDNVLEGAILVRLDTTAIDARIRVTQARKAQVEAQMRAMSLQSRVQGQRNLKEFEGSVETLELELLRTQAIYESRSSELKGLDAQLTTARALLKQQAIAQPSVDALEARRQTVEQEAAAAQRASALINNQLRAARARRGALPQDALSSGPAQPLDAELEVVSRELDQLETEREQCILRAPASGMVTEIALRPGSPVRPGDQILTLTAPSTRRVIACLPEHMSHPPRIGSLVSVTGERSARRGKVVAISPRVGILPPECRSGALPVWGRTVEVQLQKSVSWASGLPVSLKISSATTTSGVAHADAPGPAHGPARPQAMHVPDALRQRSSFEPSGIAWDALHRRYLLVSDDTGTKGQDDHRPWLFAMNLEGHVSAEPIAIEGLNEVSDLEDLAAHADGTVVIIASQSLSKKGKRPHARQVFARLLPTPHGYRVDGQIVYLAEQLLALAPARLKELGVDDLNMLDIEAVATDDTALIVGLKSPTSTAGRGLLWRFEHPQQLFSTGQLEHGGLKLWKTVQFGRRKNGSGEVTTVGISALLKLPQAKWLIASTNARQGGDLWLASGKATERTLQATHVQQFSLNRPEGLSVVPNNAKVAVVFDDERMPAWAELSTVVLR